LASNIEDRSLTQQQLNEIGTLAATLPSFIDDAEAQRINAIYSGHQATRARKELPTEKQFLDFQSVNSFMSKSISAGTLLRSDLATFVASVERLDRKDPPYHQRVYALIGIEYVPTKKRPF
jgi:hypothetical protein